MPDDVFAGELRRGLRLAREQRPETGVDALDVLTVERPNQEPIHLRE
jgi:hypothetical protein